MFIFNWYAIMTVRKFVDSRKEMRMENQKEKSTKKRRMLKFIGSYRSCSGFGNRTWGNWTAQCNHIGEQDYENRI